MPLSAKLMIIGLFGTLIALFAVQEDLRLTYLGEKTDAEVMEEFLVSATARREAYISVEYRFKDETGNFMTGGGRLPITYIEENTPKGVPKGMRVKVLFLRGNSKISKMEASPTSNMYTMLYVCPLLLIGGYILSSVQANAHVRKRVADHAQHEAAMPIVTPEPRKRSEPETLEL